MKPVSPEAKDTSIKVLAVVLAIAIWAVAISDKQRTSPSPKIELVVKAPVSLRNLPDDLIVTDLPETVVIRLRGPKDLESTALESTVAVVDLEGAKPGQNLFPIEVVAPNGFELVRASRAVADLTLEKRAVVSLPVDIAIVAAPHFNVELEHDLTGALHLFCAQKVPDDFRSEAESLAEGGASLGQGLSEGGTEPEKAADEEMGASAGSASGLHGGRLEGSESELVDGLRSSVSVSVSPAEVSIEGPETAVSRVARAVAMVAVGHESTVVVPVLALDIHGQTVSDVIVYPETVTVDFYSKAIW